MNTRILKSLTVGAMILFAGACSAADLWNIEVRLIYKDSNLRIQESQLLSHIVRSNGCVSRTIDPKVFSENLMQDLTICINKNLHDSMKDPTIVGFSFPGERVFDQSPEEYAAKIEHGFFVKARIEGPGVAYRSNTYIKYPTVSSLLDQ